MVEERFSNEDVKYNQRELSTLQVRQQHYHMYIVCLGFLEEVFRP